jgi:hypothetical protein
MGFCGAFQVSAREPQQGTLIPVGAPALEMPREEGPHRAAQAMLMVGRLRPREREPRPWRAHAAQGTARTCNGVAMEWVWATCRSRSDTPE